MIFTTFRDFSEFFLTFNDFIFYLNRFKINKNNKKNIYFARRARVDALYIFILKKDGFKIKK